VVGLLTVGFYIDACLGATALIHMPTKQVPTPTIIFDERNPYETDCYGIEDSWCWWYPYDT